MEEALQIKLTELREQGPFPRQLKQIRGPRSLPARAGAEGGTGVPWKPY